MFAVAPEMQEPVPGEVRCSRCPGSEIPIEQGNPAGGQDGDVGLADVAMDDGLRSWDRGEPAAAVLAEVKVAIAVRRSQYV